MATPSRTGTPAELDASAGNGNVNVSVPADCNLVVAMGSHWDGNGGSTLLGLTLNGVPFTFRSQLAEGATTGEPGGFVATLVSPATGTQNVAWTWSAGGARTEGGEIFLIWYKAGNISDPVRAAGTDAATGSTAPSVGLADTATTDTVVGHAQRLSGNSVITGVTVFIDNSTLNSEGSDVGDTTGVSGLVTVGNSNPNYSTVAAISLKESAAFTTFFQTIAATAVGSAVVSLLSTYFRTLAATAVGTPIISRLSTYPRALAATAVGAAALSTALVASISMAATVIGVVTLNAGLILVQAISSVAIGIAVITTQFIAGTGGYVASWFKIHKFKLLGLVSEFEKKFNYRKY